MSNQTQLYSLDKVISKLIDAGVHPLVAKIAPTFFYLKSFSRKEYAKVLDFALGKKQTAGSDTNWVRFCYAVAAQVDAALYLEFNSVKYAFYPGGTWEILEKRQVMAQPEKQKFEEPDYGLFAKRAS